MRSPRMMVRLVVVFVLVSASVEPAAFAQKGSSAQLHPPGRQVETAFEEAMTMELPGGVDAVSEGGEPVEADPPKSSAGAPALATPGWTTILSEGAEGSFPSDNGWVVYDGNSTSGSDYWDDLSCRSYSGSWSVWSAAIGDQPDCGNYDNDMTSWMIFGPFDLSDASDARAEFEVWTETEAPDIPYDYFFWGASTDGSNFSGYRLTQNTGWSLRELDLTNVPTLGDLTGDSSVWFAFVFVSDFSVNSYEGSYVDDILIEKLVPSGPPDIRIEPLSLTFDPPVSSGVQAALDAPRASEVAAQGPPRIDGRGYDDFFTEQARQVDYDGHVVGSDGEPVTGHYPLQVAYFDADGKPAFAETFSDVAISRGDFRVTLGAGEPQGSGRYASLAELFAAQPQAEMEISVAGTTYGPRLGILPAGHSLETRMVAAGLRERADGQSHWEGYRSRSGATAVQAAVLSPRPADSRARTSARGGEARRGPYTLPVVGPVSSAPVSSLPVIQAKVGRPVGEVNPPRHETLHDGNGHRYGTTTPKIDDPLAGLHGPATSSPSPSLSFEGIGNVQGVLPPDTEGAVGPNHYVQVVNDSFAIYNKSGTLLVGPVLTNTLWSGFGGPCETDNSGDAIFLYDQQADRFVLSQFAVVSNHQSVCFAVSQTADPTGSYYLYEVVTPRFPDYYKVGVWPEANNNAYFFGTNSGYKGQYDVFALDRANMLAGATARSVQFFQGFDNLMMPADVDGAAGPPTGSPGLFYTFRDGGEPYFDSPSTDSLDLWEFDVDWTTPGNSTFTMAQSFTPAGGLAAFNWTVCGFFVSDCIPQPGTSQGIDSASWWPMQRLVYRNYGDHEALAGAWTVNVSSTGIRAAPRWFELRNTGSGWSIYQQGTQSPDAIDRWMPSVAMDGSGGLALGYSRGDGTHYPSIYYATRSAGDTLGTLSTEALLYAGTGSQTHSAARWGDYSSMELDPADDCTFWYTTEYLPTTSSADWHTRVGTFTLPGCSPSSGGSKSFTIYNDGATALQVSSMALDSPGSWISWAPDAPFSVPAGGAKLVTVSIDFGLAPSGQSTRTLLVSSDDPDESPYPGGVDIVVNGDSSCYALTLGHSGSGADPVANPTSSSGCSAGTYHSGESVALTASPAGGWQVDGWIGTSNDASTSTSSSLTMPAAAHTASVVYVQTGGGPPTDLVLSNTTLSSAGTHEACNSITVGPNVFFSAGGAGVVVRAPKIIFIPEVGTLTGAVAVFDGTKPAACP